MMYTLLNMLIKIVFIRFLIYYVNNKIAKATYYATSVIPQNICTLSAV